MPQRHVRSLGSFGILLLAIACARTDTITTPVARVASISLAVTNTKIAVREQAQIVPTFLDATGHTLVDVAGVTWSSSDPATVAVDQTGLIAGVSLGGPVTITASRDGVSGTATISVQPILQFSPLVASIGVDSVATLGVRLTDYMGATIGTAPATWTSSNTNIARVDSTGRLVGVAPGAVVITATYSGVQLTISVEVGVISLLDGTWAGSYIGRPGSVVVLFGEVRSFSFPITGGGCTAPFSATGHFAIVANRFSLNLPYQSTATGEFTDANLLNVAVSEVKVTQSAYSCSPGSAITVNGPIPAATFTASR